MNKKNLLVLMSLVSSVVIFSGCQATKELNSLMGIPNTSKEYISKSGDKELATIFSKYMNTYNPRTGRVSINSIVLYEKHFDFDDYIKQYELQDKVAQAFDQSKIVKEYKNTILKRGNSFKLYKNSLNKELIKSAYNISKLKTRDKYSYYRYDWTPCIIEFDKNGQIKSVMTQVYEISVAYNNFSDSYAPSKAESTITIFTGFKAKTLQNKISNRMFENNFLYESK